jgi:hypothetical protein
MSLKLLHHVIRDIEITKYITKQIQMYVRLHDANFSNQSEDWKRFDPYSQIFLLARAIHR